MATAEDSMENEGMEQSFTVVKNTDEVEFSNANTFSLSFYNNRKFKKELPRLEAIHTCINNKQFSLKEIQ